MKSGISLKQRHKIERQESLRELLSKQGHLQHLLELLKKIENLADVLDANEIARLKFVAEQKQKLINKYLPDDKTPQDINVGGQEGNPVRASWILQGVDADSTDAK